MRNMFAALSLALIALPASQAQTVIRTPRAGAFTLATGKFRRAGNNHERARQSARHNQSSQRSNQRSNAGESLEWSWSFWRRRSLWRGGSRGLS